MIANHSHKGHKAVARGSRRPRRLCSSSFVRGERARVDVLRHAVREGTSHALHALLLLQAHPNLHQLFGAEVAVSLACAPAPAQ